MRNRVGSDQLPSSSKPDLGLHCFQMSVYNFESPMHCVLRSLNMVYEQIQHKKCSILRTLVKSAYPKRYFSYFSANTYVVGTQKNRLNETVLLSTQTYVKIDG